ncbi:MAG: DUF4301 family protein, partial [Marinirhabdus sp.]
MFNKGDIKTIKEKNLTVHGITQQLRQYASGTPYLNVTAPATLGNGIVSFSTAEKAEHIQLYDLKRKNLDIVKFVPASGAATRMFNFLHDFLKEYDPEKQTLDKFLKTGAHPHLKTFAENIDCFAFTARVRKKMPKPHPGQKSTAGALLYSFVKTMLSKNGLNYNQLPKGLIAFHRYPEHNRTAFEEQLAETAGYAVSKDRAHVHFTFSPQHVQLFKKEYTAIKERLARHTKTSYALSHSLQKRSTETIAVTRNNTPYRDKKGELVF